LLAALLGLLCASLSSRAQTTVHFPDRSFSTLSYGGSLWIGTPRGLYRYRSEDNVWSAYGPRNGLLSAAITTLDVRGDVLWIGQDRGITAFDLRSNTMLHYDSAKGHASGVVRTAAFEEDFVWSGGTRGAARYDNLIEEWQRIGSAEGLTGSIVHAIVPQSDRVFLATERGVNEYDPRHERWRVYMPGSASPTEEVPLEGESIIDAFVAGSWFWLLREGELLRFDMDARAFSPYPLKDFRGSAIREIIVSGSGFWIVTADNLWQYDATTDALRPFLEIEQLPDRDLRAVALSGDGYTFWFSTASGVTRFVRGTSSWTYYTEANGLPDADIRNLFPLGDGVVTFTDDALFYYLPQDDRWYSFPLLKAEENGGTRFSLDPSAGSYADFGGGVRLDLSGSRSAWLFQDPFGQDESTFGEDPASRNDLKARLDLGEGRRISAIYNDSDYEDVVYGAEYRGARDDALQSLQWGDMRLEQGVSLLQQSFGIFGVGGRAVFGQRSERYGRSLLEVTASSGHKTTATHTDVFQGRFRTRESMVTDGMWLRGTYYSLRADRRREPLEARKVLLYRTLYPNETRGLYDLMSTDIAGRVADWRPLDEGSDYVVDREHSIVKLLGENSWSVMAARLPVGDTHTDLLLCDETAQYLEIRNRYEIGYAIIPSTLLIRIVDLNGSAVPLSRFGLDGDNDGHVDPEFMDYAEGELRFPEDHPFPPGAYESPGIVSYTMHVTYESFSTSFMLRKWKIVRGSERVLVDGLPASAGEDYILDYSSGYLVFTRDGAVLDDSRVEISYEYIRNDADERVTQAAVTLSPSDFTQASVSGGVFHEENAAVQTRFVQGGGELRWQSDALDLRLRPEYRHTSSDSASGDAAGISAAVSTRDARISLQSTIRSDGYREPVAGSYAYGRLRSDHALKGEYDITSALRLFATHRQREGVDTLTGRETEDRASSAGLQWVRQDWPSVTLKGDYLTLRDGLGERLRRGGRVDAAWTPSSGLLGTSGFHAARISGYARLSEEDVNEERGDADYRTQNYFMRVLLSPRSLFTINAWYKGDAREHLISDDAYQKDYQTDKMYLDVLMEHLRGLSFGGRFTRDVSQMSTSASLQDRQTASSVQTNVRIAPGTWVNALQPFTLYASVMYNHGSYHRQDLNPSGLFSSFFAQAEGRTTSRNHSTWYETRIEWRPTAVFLYSATAILRRFHSETWNSAGDSQFWQLLQRVDYRPDSRALYGVQFNLRRDDGNSAFLAAGWTYEPALWTERRLSRALLLRLTLNSSWREGSTSYAIYRGFSIDPSGSLTLSLEDLAILRRLEFRADGSYSYGSSQTEFYFAPSETRWSSSINSNFYLDLYPHPVLFVRFRYFLRWRSDYYPNYRIFGIDGWEQPDAELQIVMQL
jgi:hypothetical protein